MGLPGSGKSTLVNELAPLLNAVVFNNDAVRKNINRDLGFSIADRIEQATRMGWLCDQVVKAGHCAIADFVCPTAQTRAAFRPDFTVFVNTIGSCRYENTNQLFEPPEHADIVISEFAPARSLAVRVRNALVGTEPKSLFIGRYQPFHSGHAALIESVLAEGKQVVIALRDTASSASNPYTLAERREMIRARFSNRVQIISIPDISEVCYGRAVGWGVREIRLPAEIEAISATSLRSSAVEHLHGKQKVVGSSPTAGSTLCTTSLNGGTPIATEAGVPCANPTSIITGIAEHGKTSGPM